MSKKNKNFKREMRERGRAMRELGELKVFMETDEKRNNSNNDNSKTYERKTYVKKDKSEPELFNIEPNENKNAFSLKIALTAKGIPVIPEFATDDNSRFIIFTSGDKKRPVWTPADNGILSNGIQALIPVKVGNLVIEYDAKEKNVYVYKINFIDTKNKKISLYLYNKFSDGKWDKEIFDSISFIADYAIKKVTDKTFMCYSTEVKNKEEK